MALGRRKHMIMHDQPDMHHRPRTITRYMHVCRDHGPAWAGPWPSALALFVAGRGPGLGPNGLGGFLWPGGVVLLAHCMHEAAAHSAFFFKSSCARSWRCMAHAGGLGVVSRGTGPNIRLIRPCLSAVLTPSGFHIPSTPGKFPKSKDCVTESE